MKAISLKGILTSIMSPFCLLAATAGIAQAVTYTQQIDWTMVYNANVLPHEAGAINYSNSQTGPWGDYYGGANPLDTATAISRLGLSIVDDEYLGFDTTGAAWATLSNAQVDQFFLNTDIGYTVEYRVRVLSAYNTQTSNRANNPAGGGIDMNDGRAGINAFWQFGFGEDVDNPGQTFVQLRGAAGTPIVHIDDRWITYTILAQGSTVTYYMDGVEMYSATLRTNVADTGIRWGNLSGSALGVEMEVDYVKVYDQGAIAPIP